MTPIEFPEQNNVLVLAKDQPKYLDLPCYCDNYEFVSCWQLSWWERLVLLFTGKLWLRQLNFGMQPQPQKPQTENPFSD